MRYSRRRSTGLARVSSEPSVPARSGISAMLALAGVKSTALACVPEDTIVLADVSGSMLVSPSGDSYDADKMRISVLSKALVTFTFSAVIPFDSYAHDPCDPADLPRLARHRYGGGTDYIEALRAAGQRRSGAVLLMSDGTSGQGDRAVDAAKRLGRPVHTMFIGDPGDLDAIGALRAIAEATGGRFTTADLGLGTLALTAAITSTLALPQNAGQAIAL